MTPRTPWTEYERVVSLYTEAGAAETVQRIVTAMSRLSRRLDVFYRERFDALDLANGEWKVLQALALEGRGGSSHPSRLADSIGVTASTMTHRLDGMAERGLIERSADPGNRTRTLIRLTRDGWDLFRAGVLDVEPDEAGVFAPLTEAERGTLARLLEKALLEKPAGTERGRGHAGGER